jgi:hypothetical protein
MSNEDPALDRDRSQTVGEFCIAEKLSRSSYYGLKKRGLGPEETHPPGTAIVRISPWARREWHARMKQLRDSKAAALEEERRRAQAQHAGMIAAQSPLHVSKRNRRQLASRASENKQARRRPE